MEKTRERNKPYSLWKRRLDSGRFVYYVRFRLDSGGWSSAKSSRQSDKQAAIIWAVRQLDERIPRTDGKARISEHTNENPKDRRTPYRKSYLTQGEVNALFAQEWDDCRCLAANLIAATTGLRLTEIVALRREAIQNGHLSLIPPNSAVQHVQSIAVPTRTAKAIYQCLDSSPYSDEKDFLLWSKDRSIPLGGEIIKKSLETMLDAIGISRDERRERGLTFASWSRYYRSVNSLWRKGNELYRRMVEKSAEAICRLDARGRIIYANQYTVDILGYKDSREILGKRSLNILSETCREKGRAMEKRRRAGFSDRYETSLIRRDGSILYVKISAVPLEENGRFQGTLVTASDINDEKEALRQSLQRSEQRLTDLVDKFPIAICAVGRDSQVKYLNSSGGSLFGFKGTGKHRRIALRDRVPTDVRPRYDRALFAVLSRGETRSLIMDILVEAAERMTALWRFSPIKEGDLILGSYIAIVDIGGGFIKTKNLPSDIFYSRFGLTERERDIADFLLAGLRYKEIASRLSIALPTARTHIMNMYRKLDIHSSDDLSRLAKRWQCVQTNET